MSLCLLDTPFFIQTLLEDTPVLVLYRLLKRTASLLQLDSLLFSFIVGLLYRFTIQAKEQIWASVHLISLPRKKKKKSILRTHCSH